MSIETFIKGWKLKKKVGKRKSWDFLNIKLIRSQASCWITTLFELYAFKTPWLSHCCMKLMWQRFWQPGSTFPSRHVRPCRYNVRTCADTCIRHWLCILSLWRRTNARKVCLETLHGGQFTSSTNINKTKLACSTLRQCNTVSLETYPFNHKNNNFLACDWF